MLSGWLGGSLIEGDGLRSGREAVPVLAPAGTLARSMLSHVILLSLAVGAGAALSGWVSRGGPTLLFYVGGMIVAAAVRNADDRFGWFRLAQPVVDQLGSIALYFFIVMAMVSLRWWELWRLALPVLGILLVQVVLVVVVARMIAFRLLGRDYPAAVAASGWCGFMLGIAANSMASMEVPVGRHGPALRAFLAVPMVGTFLGDFINALIIAPSADLVRPFLIK